MAPVEELTPTQFRERWPSVEAPDVVVLDVREPAELERAALPGTLNIPMRQVPGRIAELDRDKPLVVMCHLGGRSRQVAQYLASVGFDKVFSLKGGIDAWSTEIDPQVPRY